MINEYLCKEYVSKWGLSAVFIIIFKLTVLSAIIKTLHSRFFFQVEYLKIFILLFLIHKMTGVHFYLFGRTDIELQNC